VTPTIDKMLFPVTLPSNV